MDHQNTSAPPCAPISRTRRLVAVGVTRPVGARTLTVRATAAGITGTLIPRGGAR